jgi:hypothetical protein
MNNPWIIHQQKYKGQGLTREHISDLYYGKKTTHSTKKSTNKTKGGGVTGTKPKVVLRSSDLREIGGGFRDAFNNLKLTAPGVNTKTPQEINNERAFRVIQDALANRPISQADRTFMEFLGSVVANSLRLAIAKGRRLEEIKRKLPSRPGGYGAKIMTSEEKAAWIDELQTDITLGIGTPTDFEQLYWCLHYKPKGFVDNIREIYNLIVPHLQQIGSWICSNVVTQTIAGAGIPEVSDVFKSAVSLNEKLQSLPNTLLTDEQIRTKQRNEDAHQAYLNQRVGGGIQINKKKKKHKKKM